ncbi:MAG: TetR family transcriptional regulator [Streptosporangiaceae bacterium]
MPRHWRNVSLSSAGPARRRTGRRSGDSGTREAIIAAARRRFGEQGYDAASIRAIAADAGVDPALVHHFYGTKEELFAVAMELPAVPSERIGAMLAAERAKWGPKFADHLGETLVRTVLTVWGAVDVGSVFLSLLRSAPTNEHATAALVASQIVGLGFTRYVLRLEPLATASTEDLVAAIGPTVQRYLTGEI